MELIDKSAALEMLRSRAETAHCDFKETSKDTKLKAFYEKCAYKEAVFDTWQDAETEISRMPTIEAEPVKHGRWIPCSERLPENNQRVIFTGYDPDLYICCDDGSNNYILVGWYKAEQGRGKSLGYKSLRKGFYAENPKGTSTRMHEDFVTHWMPLPEPPESEVQ